MTNAGESISQKIGKNARDTGFIIGDFLICSGNARTAYIVCETFKYQVIIIRK